ncbi:GlsB/YeaQ/YmgE family stress response membrane protein [Rhizobium rhizogenes]|uniref:GlsB/YeaQ/YmgE family stress response membrane protein n=1 Tax=Rhizobium rhizogenes TaxID=359 RepID=UPI000647B845|nr:GlsB/YeaQ/YmgE family stress response membrane protein [Rhizobium rhizogenes]
MEVGWIAAIVIGGLAGWFAEMIMKSDTGIIMNIVLGIVGALVASWLFGILGLTLPFNALVNYLITGFIGACILIFVGRLIRR